MPRKPFGLRGLRRGATWEWHPNGYARRLTPGGRWHHHWCAVFYGKSCDCDDDLGDPEPGLRRPLSGGSLPLPDKKRQTVVRSRQRQRVLENA
jgi:hypothetical protein